MILVTKSIVLQAGGLSKATLKLSEGELLNILLTTLLSGELLLVVLNIGMLILLPQWRKMLKTLESENSSISIM